MGARTLLRWNLRLAIPPPYKASEAVRTQNLAGSLPKMHPAQVLTPWLHATQATHPGDTVAGSWAPSENPLELAGWAGPGTPSHRNWEQSLRKTRPSQGRAGGSSELDRRAQTLSQAAPRTESQPWNPPAE